jgi:hypothetical protein
MGDNNVTLNALNIGNLTTGTSAAETAIHIGTGWDSVLQVNGVTIIDGDGDIQTAGIEDGAVTNAKLADDTVDFDKISDSPTLDADTTLSAGAAQSFNIGNNVTLTTSGSGAINASDLVCTDCINATEIADVYVLNSGDTITGDIVVDRDITGDNTVRTAQSIDVDIATSDQTADLTGLNINLSTGAVDITGATSEAVGLNVDVSGVDAQSSASAYAATFQGGNVGIGTAAPVRVLHISDAMRLEPRSAAPSSAALGDFYVDSDSSSLCFHNGTAWVAVTGGGPCT